MDQNNQSRFEAFINNKIKFNLFLLSKVPMAYLAGVKVTAFDDEKVVVSIPYKYLTKNPFNSIYFACLAMAAELTTGILAMKSTYNSSPKILFIVVGMEANFTKKAVGKIYFECKQGKEFEKAVNEAIRTGESQQVRAESIGRDEKGDQVAQFFITWSFKAKK